LGVETVIVFALLDFIENYRTFMSGVFDYLAQRLLQLKNLTGRVVFSI
jgi:hypothetical protein